MPALLSLSIASVTYFLVAYLNYPPVVWFMLNVTPNKLQADAHLIRFERNRWFLIDAGDPDETLVPALKRHGVRRLEAVIISHAHKDHYGGLHHVISAGIPIDRVYFNVPDPAICEIEKPWGCDFNHVSEWLKSVTGSGVPVTPVVAGSVLLDSPSARLQILYAYDGVNTPVGKTDINDMSAILKLTVGSQRVLFTGDLNHKLGEYLARNGKGIEAEFLKVPHHGTEVLAPNEFFDRVGAHTFLVPSHEELWFTDRSRRVREYVSDRNIRTFIAGVDGEVSISFRRLLPPVVHAEKR